MCMGHKTPVIIRTKNPGQFGLNCIPLKKIKKKKCYANRSYALFKKPVFVQFNAQGPELLILCNDLFLNVYCNKGWLVDYSISSIVRFHQIVWVYQPRPTKTLPDVRLSRAQINLPIKFFKAFCRQPENMQLIYMNNEDLETLCSIIGLHTGHTKDIQKKTVANAVSRASGQTSKNKQAD